MVASVGIGVVSHKILGRFCHATPLRTVVTRDAGGNIEHILKVGEKAISNGYVDMVGIGRQALADPDVEQILKSEARYCVRCNGCRELLLSQMPIGCTQYDKFYTIIRDSTRLHFTAPWRKKPDDSRKL